LEFDVRILVDIGEKQIHALDTLSKGAKRSRTALIRDAVGDYLARHRAQQPADAFGLWGDEKIDGLAYQEKIRGEW
jgi:predicted transcriptional regulator